MRGLQTLLFGTLECRVTEVFDDLFFDTCAKNGIRLRNVRKSPGLLCFTLQSHEKKKIMKASHSTGAKLEIIKEKGLFSTVKRYRMRWGIPVGMFLFILLFFFLSGMIWGVEAEGLSKIDTEKFLSYMAQANIRRGVFAVGIDCNEAERYAEKYSDIIEKVTVNLVGCRIFIRVKERTVPPEVQNEKTYANIVAKKDGEILSADFFSGTPEVHVGDAVTAGQLLAGGIVELGDGSVRFLFAQARIIARTHTPVNCYTTRTFRAATIQKIKKYVLPYIFVGFSSVQKNGESEIFMASNRFLCLNSTVLPLGYTRSYKISFKQENVFLNENEAFLICFSDYALTAYEKLRKINIVERLEHIRMEKVIQLESDFICEEDIAEQKFFELISDKL